jgi:hypothetical protein
VRIVTSACLTFEVTSLAIFTGAAASCFACGDTAVCGAGAAFATDAGAGGVETGA